MANTNVTIKAANVGLLPLPERTAGFTHRFRVSYTDVNFGTGNADTVTMTLGTTPTNFFVSRAAVVISTAFAGTTAFTMTVGLSTSATCILASGSTLSSGMLLNTNGANVVNAPATAAGSTATAIIATFTNATGGSPSALSAGILDIFLGYENPLKLDGPYINQ